MTLVRDLLLAQQHEDSRDPNDRGPKEKIIIDTVHLFVLCVLSCVVLCLNIWSSVSFRLPVEPEDLKCESDCEQILKLCDNVRAAKLCIAIGGFSVLTSVDLVLTQGLKTITYGMSKAPFLAIKTLQQLAQDEKSRFPLASEVLLHDAYMDDIVCGVSDLETAQKLQSKLRDALHFCVE
ncbi:DUF1758 domain-containing protein [Trichonephila clavata]|uniref:DUF1758 domain-containing protein n=1 Tax=Trichonephila clavata TaxID=2740835 RepID=A0A8X6IKW8_TRICU|nr:DUF1758 domain-containing protein [Trichonephila clavata]